MQQQLRQQVMVRLLLPQVERLKRLVPQTPQQKMKQGMSKG
jgi:hypothetical protein